MPGRSPYGMALPGEERLSLEAIAQTARTVLRCDADQGADPPANSKPPFGVEPGVRAAQPGQQAVGRFRTKWPDAILIHAPVHASRLNQVEIHLSIVQGNVLPPQRLLFCGRSRTMTLLPPRPTPGGPPRRSSRPSPAAIFTPLWPRSALNGWLQQTNRNTSRYAERQYLASS